MKQLIYGIAIGSLALCLGAHSSADACCRRVRRQCCVTCRPTCPTTATPTHAAADTPCSAPAEAAPVPAAEVTPAAGKIPAGEKHWYKVEVHTAADESGGTESDAYLRFATAAGHSDWYYLKSDIGVYKGGEIDLYYFLASGLDQPTGAEISLKAAGDDPAWTHELWLFELDGTEWKEVFHQPRQTTAPGKEVSNPPTDATRVIPSCSCHVSADKDAPRYPSGTTWPPGVEVCAPSR